MGQVEDSAETALDSGEAFTQLLNRKRKSRLLSPFLCGFPFCPAWKIKVLSRAMARL
jgi:hypothetical protein